MDISAQKLHDLHPAPPAASMRGRLFRKYMTMFATVVCSVLVANGAFEIWFSYREQKSLLVRIQHEQAEAAAANISQFMKEIQGQMAWATMLSWENSTFDDWGFDAVRFLREVPAVTEVAQFDQTGRELFRISRQAMDVVASRIDHSQDPFFVQAMANKVYYGPVYFVGGSEPYMTLAMAGDRPDYGVIEAQVNLKFIWDVVSQIKVGHRGYAYVTDANRRLIAHPDLSLVLRNTDMSYLPQVKAAGTGRSTGSAGLLTAVDAGPGSVLSTYAVVNPLDWLVFVELPTTEAFAPIYNSIIRSAGLLLAALAIALLAGLALARRMVVPIRALHDGAAQVGSGDLTHRISINSDDELEALGGQFNNMAARLQESYTTLEQKVEERTRQLEAANAAKSRFLAAASHDLRQPLHALGLFVGQLRERMNANQRKNVINYIETALSAMNELFNALLDISKLDAGATTVNITDFPVARLLARAETTFAEAAREKGLFLRVVQCSAWVRSDFILLERIVFNLISNAVRYTKRGGIVIGCRRRGGHLRIEICDTGVGIPPDQHEKIFGEFYRLGEPDRDCRAGLGLGLAIVERLCRLLNHAVSVSSISGKGSTFAVELPLAQAGERPAAAPKLAASQLDSPRGKLVVVIDDDPLVREGMGGIFRSWGCEVITAETDAKALNGLTKVDHLPDLIISDYYLSEGKTGLEIVETLRGILAAEIPAFLISGDTKAHPLKEAKAKGFHLLHKPVDPMALRAMFNQAIKHHSGPRAAHPDGQ